MKREGIRYITPVTKIYTPDPKLKRREVYATDEQFFKVQLYLDKLKAESKK